MVGVTPDAGDSNGAACAGVERGAGDERPGAGCAAEGAALGAGDAADAVLSHAVDGAGVEMAVCASGGGTEKLVQPSCCPWR